MRVEEIEEMFPDTVVIRLRGMFYNAADKSAIVLSSVTSYQLKQTSPKSKLKCGFPSNALEKVTDLLRKEQIDFAIFEGNDLIDKESFGTKNTYVSWLAIHDFEKESAKELETQEERQTEKQEVIQIIVPYEFIAPDQTEAYVQLGKRMQSEISDKKRVVALSFQGSRREVSGLYVLSGIVVYEAGGNDD